MNTPWIVVIGALNTHLVYTLYAKRIDRNVIPAYRIRTFFPLHFYPSNGSA